MMVRLSVVIPVYNAEKYLRQCLDSVLSQTFVEWECVLVDDGSLDASADICDEYANKDTRFVVSHQGNGGVSAARNAGIRLAKGEYITFVDADDWISENYLSGLLEKTDETRMALANVQCYDMATNSCFQDYLGKRYAGLSSGVLYPHVKVRSYFSTPVGKLIPKSVYKGSAFSTKYDSGEDGLYMFSIASCLPPGTKADANVVYYRRCVSGSLSRKRRGRLAIVRNQLFLLVDYWKVFLRQKTKCSLLFFITRNIAVLSHISKGN